MAEHAGDRVTDLSPLFVVLSQRGHQPRPNSHGEIDRDSFSSAVADLLMSEMTGLHLITASVAADVMLDVMAETIRTDRAGSIR